MGLYDQSEVMSEAFGEFIDSYQKVLPDGVNKANWWTTNANGFRFHGRCRKEVSDRQSIESSIGLSRAPLT